MRALWSDRQNCFHNVSQKVKRICRFSERIVFGDNEPKCSNAMVARPEYPSGAPNAVIAKGRNREKTPNAIAAYSLFKEVRVFKDSLP